MAGLHECPYCHFRFEDRAALDDHLDTISCTEEQNPS